MSAYDLTHLRDDALLRGLDSLAAQDRTTTANLLAHIAEVDARRLYAPAGYSSMHAYCVEKLRLSDDSTWKRLQVARQGRKYPQIFAALAGGRVHLSGLVLLAAHVNSENVDRLLTEATGRRKSEIEVMVAGLCPQAEVLRLDEGIAALPASTPAPIVANPTHEMVAQPAPGQVVRPVVQPIAPRRFNVQMTVGQEGHDLLREAQDLLGHAVPSGDVAEIFVRAMRMYVGELKKRKFAKSERPRRSQAVRRLRTISAEVRRAVSERDGYRCTYVSPDGIRCSARKRLEFDHVIPVARGGRATVGQLRLRCRTHNQYEADRTFGTTFMEEKRGRTRTA